MAENKGFCRVDPLLSSRLHRNCILGGNQVPTVDSQILAVFLARIAQSDPVNGTLVHGLSDMLSSDKLPKCEDLVRLYAASSEDIHA
jgi:hypothetical protein